MRLAVTKEKVMCSSYIGLTSSLYLYCKPYAVTHNKI